MPDPILELREIRKTFRARGAFFKAGIPVIAVGGVSLEVRKGEVVGLIGQSGSGKTTVGRIATRLVEPSSGTVHFDGSDITRTRGRLLRHLRRRFQMVYQDPYQSLNPRLTIRDLLAEPLLVHNLASGASVDAAVDETLEAVGLGPARSFRKRHPHELSGGQRQRVAVGRAIIVRPDLLVADEPVSMLDVSVRSGILRLLATLREERELSQLLITHDLTVAKHTCDRIVVMRDGQIVEEGPSHSVLSRPRAAYTRSLLDSIPERRFVAAQNPH